MHVGLGLHLIVDGCDRCGSRLPHVDRCIGLLLHHGGLERDNIVDTFVDIDRVGETIGRRVGVDIGIIVHRHANVVHFQLFTHQTRLFFGLDGKSLIMQEPLEVMLSKSLGSVEIGWGLLVELVVGIDKTKVVEGRFGGDNMGGRS